MWAAAQVAAQAMTAPASTANSHAFRFSSLCASTSPPPGCSTARRCAGSLSSRRQAACGEKVCGWVGERRRATAGHPEWEQTCHRVAYCCCTLARRCKYEAQEFRYFRPILPRPLLGQPGCQCGHAAQRCWLLLLRLVWGSWPGLPRLPFGASWLPGRRRRLPAHKTCGRGTCVLGCMLAGVPACLRAFCVPGRGTLAKATRPSHPKLPPNTGVHCACCSACTLKDAQSKQFRGAPRPSLALYSESRSIPPNHRGRRQHARRAAAAPTAFSCRGLAACRAIQWS